MYADCCLHFIYFQIHRPYFVFIVGALCASWRNLEPLAEELQSVVQI